MIGALREPEPRALDLRSVGERRLQFGGLGGLRNRVHDDRRPLAFHRRFVAQRASVRLRGLTVRHTAAMARAWRTKLATSLMVSCALTAASCGGQGTSRAQSEVRALYNAVAADGRAHRFVSICDQDYSGLLKQLDYLFKIDCAKDLAAAWAEGVQLTHIGPHTRIVISGRTATVFDGASPDRVYFTQGRWMLAEIPRNRRHARPNEALEVAKELNPGFRKEHLPELTPETPAP